MRAHPSGRPVLYHAFITLRLSPYTGTLNIIWLNGLMLPIPTSPPAHTARSIGFPYASIAMHRVSPKVEKHLLLALVALLFPLPLVLRGWRGRPATRTRSTRPGVVDWRVSTAVITSKTETSISRAEDGTAGLRCGRERRKCICGSTRLLV
jgi:hypothetical protein